MKKLFILLLFIFVAKTANSQTIFYDNFANPDDWYITSYSAGPTTWEVSSYATNSYMGYFNSSSGDNYAVISSSGETGEQNCLIAYNYKLKVNGKCKPHIRFEQFFEKWGDERTGVVLFTHNGDSADFIEVNADYLQNYISGNSDTIDLDISDYIDGQDSIYVGFKYYSATGDNYGWYIDDVSLYYAGPANDAELTDIGTLGKLPFKYATPHAIKANITNTGSETLSSLQVSLQVTGANTFSNTKTINNLLAGDNAIVTFSEFTPTNLGVNNIHISVPNDDENTNNSLDFRQEVSYNTFSWADTSAVYTSLGIEYASGMTLVKYHINEAKYVLSVNVHLYDAQSIGKKVYGVLLDKDGKEIARSEDFTIQNADLDVLHNFKLSNPVLLSNTDFYVGLAQYESGVAYYPVACQEEQELPIDRHYYALDLIPSELYVSTSLLRPIIEAVVGDPSPSICLLSSNDNGNTEVVWERIKTGSIKKYNIYRENSDVGVFDYLGESNYSQPGIFIDNTASKNTRQYAYKITAVDTMDNESAKSPYHKTMLLQFSGGIDAGVVNLDWKPYVVEGKSYQFKKYRIYRSLNSDSTNMVIIDSIPGDQLGYTDHDAFATKYKVFYRVAGLTGDTCSTESLLTSKSSISSNLKAGGGVYVQSVSNMEDNKIRQVYTGIQYMAYLYQVSVYPNPVGENSKITFQLPDNQYINIEAFDLIGKKLATIYSGTCAEGYHEISLNNKLQQLGKGVYLIRFKTPSTLISNQIIKTK